MEFIAKDPILEFQPGALEAIRQTFGMDRKIITESINMLEEWLEKQHHFIKKDYDRSYLERALITCKGSVEKAKAQIDKLCTLKTLLPKFFMENDVKTDLKTVTDKVCVLPLPKMTKDYYRVYVIKINEKELTPANYLEYYRLSIAISEYLKAHDYVNGYVVVEDLRHINMSEFISKLNMVEMQQFMAIMTEGYGARLLGIHIISRSKVVDLLTTTLKRFLSPKISSRIYVHPTIESVHEVVDKDILPEEYGGKERSIDQLNKDWIEILSTEKHKEYMKMMNAASTDESLRRTDKFNEEYLGAPGTFRTLSLD